MMAQYVWGNCRDLPDFVPSPGVACAVATNGGEVPGFVAEAVHPSAKGPCEWHSDPAPGTTNPVCVEWSARPVSTPRLP